jgi:hypothetical protein
MDNTPGRYGMYRYESMLKMKFHEFGNYVMRGCYLHPKDGLFVLAYDGHRIAEFYPDDTCMLVIPSIGLPNAVAQRWSEIAPNVAFSIETKRRVTGVKDYAITRTEMSYVRGTYMRKKTGEVTTNSKLYYYLDGSISTEGIPQRVAIQDRKKYRAFNAELKKLRAVLYAQIKMHVHSEDLRDWKKRSQLQTQIDAVLADLGCEKRYEDSNAMVLVQLWMKDQDPVRARQIAMLGFARCRSSSPGISGMMLQVTNILGRAQRSYLKEHCVTIQEAIPGSPHDQQSELQPSDGLREMRVSGEAEVHRQDPGTSASATPGQD